MIHTTPLLDFDDLVIVPEIQTHIASRKEINPCDKNGMLPLFTAPMDTVISTENDKEFLKNRIYPVLPRTEDAYNGYVSYDINQWRSYSIEQFQKVFIEDSRRNVNNHNPMYALIDVANGHMNVVFDMVVKAKLLYADRLILMVGNIANPATFNQLAKAGADYVRVGIGNGGGCLTTQQTGIGFPMASLVQQCFIHKKAENYKTKIVADGGMKKYSDIIKALACGADYVMIGNLFNKALESCSPNMVDKGNNYYVPYEHYYNNNIGNLGSKRPKTQEELMVDGVLFKKYRGMSTKEVQESLGNTILKTSEGIVKYQKVEYTLKTWVENFTDYLRSAMSYTNSLTLNEFIGDVWLQAITPNAFARFNK
jgi:GMP reductase